MRAFSPLHRGKAAPFRRKSRAWFDVARPALVVLVAIAFAAQAFLVQTHIHGVTQVKLTTLSATSATAGQTKGKPPALPDEKSCPLCRLSAFVGSCVVPLVAAILPQTTSVPLPPPEPVRFLLVEAESFHWQTRAPPR